MIARRCLHRRRSAGSVMLETVIALPVVLGMGLMVVQWALVHEARAFVEYGALMAARAGALENGRTGPMKTALARALTPLKVPESSSLDFETRFATRARPDVELNGRIRILNPTREAFLDHGRRDDRGRTYLPFRDVHRGGARRGGHSDLSLADATLLRVQVTYGYPLQIPWGGWLIREAAEAANRFARDAGLFERRLLAANRLPITATATVRLQSRAWSGRQFPARRDLPAVKRKKPPPARQDR